MAKETERTGGTTVNKAQGLCLTVPVLPISYIYSINYMAGVGVKCRGQLIMALLYADDAVLFAESEEEMRVSLRVLSEWCRE